HAEDQREPDRQDEDQHPERDAVEDGREVLVEEVRRYEEAHGRRSFLVIRPNAATGRSPWRRSTPWVLGAAGLLVDPERRDERLRVAGGRLDDVAEIDGLDHVLRGRVHRQLAARAQPRTDTRHRLQQALLVARVAVHLAQGEVEELRGDVSELREGGRLADAELVVLLEEEHVLLVLQRRRPVRRRLDTERRVALRIEHALRVGHVVAAEELELLVEAELLVRL